MKNEVYHKLMHSKLYHTLTNELFNPYSLALSKTTVEPLISGGDRLGTEKVDLGVVKFYLFVSKCATFKWYAMWMHV